MFDSYAALYWNEIRKPDVEKGKLYLDSISEFYGKLKEKDYFILNAQSVYYDITGDPGKALESEKKMLKIANMQQEEIELCRLYYLISDRYVTLGQLDSAMLYAQIAIDQITDTTFLQNFLYYRNVANIAEKQGNYYMANDYLKKSSELFGNSIKDRLDTQIIELEKKYDLSEAENRTLKARQTSMSIFIIALVLILLLSILHMITRRKRRKEKLKLMMTEYQMQQQEVQAALMKEEANKRRWLLQLYGHISDRLTFLHEEIGLVSQRFISSQPKAYKELQNLLKNANTDLRDITKTLSPDKETFFSYTHLDDEANIFSATEKMLLMLLACNADNRQLATFMNTTIESIRVRKSQLKKKMTEKGFETKDFFSS